MSAQAMYAEIEKQAGDEFPLQYAPLVKRIAYHLLGRLPASVQVDDLIQAGMVGLLEAAGKFDPSQGATFETFAGIRIRGAMLDETRSGDWTPRSVHRKTRGLTEAIHNVEKRTGGEAGEKEIAEELGISLDEYHRVLRDSAGCKLFSLDNATVAEDYQRGLVADPEDNPDRSFHNDAFKEALAGAIENLPERERLAMSLYYTDELNLREIGEVLGVSESRVSQIHSQALVRLRSRLSEWIN